MNKINAAIVAAAFGLILFGSAAAQSKASGKLIAERSVGAVRLGMTVASARKALKGMTLERSSDGEGIALIDVRKGGKTLMTLFAGEEDRESKINEQAKIEQIEVWDKTFRTSKGVYAGMLVRDVEKRYGKVRQIIESELESREYGRFAAHPKGLDFRLFNDSGTAGIYPAGRSTTARYAKGAYVYSVLVTGKASIVIADDREY